MLKLQQNSNTAEEVLTGFIERITFHNPENGFSVLRVKIPGKSDFITVVGLAIDVHTGEQLECRGNWVNDKTHGLQFKAKEIKTITPTSLQGIEKYLSSGAVKGIGPAFAKRLLKVFGENIFQIIEKHPDKLTKVEGIGTKRKEMIIQSWETQKKIREIVIFLHNYGVGTSRAVRIYKTYGDDAILRITTNPYSLANDIRGIGFKTADELAIKLGIPRDSMIRAQAGVKHVLQEFSSEGHCATEVDVLVHKAEQLLEINEDLIKDGISIELNNKNLIFDQIEGKDVLFLAGLYHAEKAVAKHIQQLCIGKSCWHTTEPLKAIKEAEKLNKINLSASQKTALITALNNKVSIITGGPGVGKTTIINSILSIIKKYSSKILLCAPTGRAAQRLMESTDLEAKTIHRTLGIEGESRSFRYNENNPLPCDLLVVDEVSMVDILLFNHLLKAIPKYSALILVGDVDQLPSVGPGSVLADLIDSEIIPCIKLTEIFRQASHSRIIVNAHRVNQGKFPIIDPIENNILTDFYFIKEEEPEQIQKKLLNVISNRIPEKFNFCPKSQIQILTPMTRGLLGTVSLNTNLQNLLNSDNLKNTIIRYGVTFAVGDKVMQTVNNYNKEVFNGDIGFITDIDMEEGNVVINFDNKNISYDLNELDEIALAYAITIHKSQGSEYPAVVMPLAMQHFMLLERNLIYTGLTRAKKLCVIIGQTKALAMAVKNKKASKRLTALVDKLRSSELTNF